MWRWVQRTGALYDTLGELIGHGYAGHDAGKNNPALQNVRNIGPVPVGIYQIEPPVDTATHGPYVLWLQPFTSNVMSGRAGFGIHGDSIQSPGSASNGCIILPRPIRQRIWTSGDHTLEVVAEETELKT